MGRMTMTKSQKIVRNNYYDQQAFVSELEAGKNKAISLIAKSSNKNEVLLVKANLEEGKYYILKPHQVFIRGQRAENPYYVDFIGTEDQMRKELKQRSRYQIDLYREMPAAFDAYIEKQNQVQEVKEESIAKVQSAFEPGIGH